jgi:L-ascorbate metabolism protein UlaG (beta-lactamase superfamily)
MAFVLSLLAVGWASQDAGVYTEGLVSVRKVSVPGYFVRAGEGAILLDGLTGSREGPDEETLELLETGSAPFQDVDLILVTHRHRDHFEAESVARHMAHNPHGVVVTGQVVAALLAEHQDFGEFSDRVVVVDPGPEEIVEEWINGFRVKIFRVSHGEPANDFSLDNLAMMVDLGGTKVFTTGDIVPPGQTGIFRRAALQEESIDFAFLPFTMFAEEFQPEAAAIIDDLIRPRHIVATHFRDVHRGAFTQACLERYPGLLILENR